jgi:hypothetical protein
MADVFEIVDHHQYRRWFNEMISEQLEFQRTEYVKDELYPGVLFIEEALRKLGFWGTTEGELREIVRDLGDTGFVVTKKRDAN